VQRRSLFLYWTLLYYTNWPSSGVQGVVVKSPAAVFFLPVLVASAYFWLGGLLVIAFGFV
jgi:hypothetical protein